MSDEKTAGASAARDISALLRARNPLLWVISKEEARAKRLLVDAAAAAQYEPVYWDCANGITGAAGQTYDAYATDPAAVVKTIATQSQRRVWIMCDLHSWLRDPTVLRALKSAALALPLAPRDQARAIVVLTSSNEVPPELADMAKVIDLPLPDRAEIAQILDAAISALPEELKASAAPNGTREAAIDAAVGLSAEEAQSCYAKSLVTTRTVDPRAVAQEKRRVIAREKVLEWFEPLAGGLTAVGGQEVLKEWLDTRKLAFTPAARAYGLPAPKGCLLVGVSGCGKSLTAKAIATAWGMPLLRLDLGALRSKYVGESEANMRKALRVSETVAPCILWVDEVEKSISGSGNQAADGGVQADQLAALLSWMQDRAGSVFVIATANDVSTLPPELLRKGRFDELWFVDLPNVSERVSILAAALREYARPIQELDLAQVALATAGFSGAEIAALVPNAMYAAFAQDERQITTQDLLDAAQRTVPLSKTAPEKIENLRNWAKGRARNASKLDVQTSNSSIKLDL